MSSSREDDLAELLGPIPDQKSPPVAPGEMRVAMSVPAVFINRAFVSIVSGVARLSFMESVVDEQGGASFPRAAITMHMQDLAELSEVIKTVLENHSKSENG